MQIASLFARIGLQTDEAKLKSFTSNLKTARQTLVGIGVAVAAASAAIGKVTSDALNAAAAFNQFEAETGASAQELQKWQAVAEQTNSSAEAVSSAIRAITQNQQAIRLGEGDISGFQLLGIDPRQDPFQILTELRTRTEGLSEAMQRNVLGRLGVGAELLQTIQLSQEEFDRLAGRAFIISPQAIDTLAQTRGAMAQAARAVEFLKAQIAVGLAPQLKELSENLILFIQRNQQAFIRGFQRAFAIVNRFGRAVATASQAIDSAVRATIGWEAALKILGVALVLLNLKALTGPLGLLTAGFIAMLLVIEDIAVFARGGESAIGRLFDLTPDEAAEKWQKWADAIKNVVDAIRDFFSPDAWGRFANEPLDETPDLAATTAQGERGRIGRFFAELFSRERLQASVRDAMARDFDLQTVGGGGIGPAHGVAIPTTPAAAGTAGTTINNHNTYNIQGPNPEEIAAEVQRINQRDRNIHDAQRRGNVVQ